MNYALFLHYGTIALIVSISAIGVAVAQGLANLAALDASNRQPQAKNDIIRLAILGTALIETSAILAVAMAFFLLFSRNTPTTMSSIAELGIAAALCLSGFAVGLASYKPVQAACHSVARQPFFAQNILRFMLITQSLVQTPVIFAFIVSIFIRHQAVPGISTSNALRLLASGLAIGLGSIGPTIGLAQFAGAACEGIGKNRRSYGKLLSFSFISQAIIETPAIFALLVALMLIFSPIYPDSALKGITFLSAGLCIGFGTLGAGISSGRTSAAACTQIALNPSLYTSLSKVSMFVQGLIDTAAVYALLIALLLYLL